MKKQGNNWLQRPNVTWQWALIAAGLWTLTLVIFDHSQMALDLEDKVARPMDFRVRDMLKRSPQLHPKIKVFGIDDSTVAWMGAPAPTMDQWAKLLVGFAQRKPRAIVVDGMFSVANIPRGEEAMAQASIAKLEALDVPVIVGSFIAPRKLRYREPLPLEYPQFDLNNLAAPGSRASDLILPKATSSFLYGPDVRLREAFKHLGHFIYQSDGVIAPYYRMSDSIGVPHFMLLTADTIKIIGSQLHVNGHEVPSYRDGNVAINFSTYQSYLRNTIPLKQNLQLSQEGKPLRDVEPDDYVYVMPLLYTGNTDFKQTPFGPMPGGYAQLAVLNSIVNGDWLHPLWMKEIFVALACLLGTVVAMNSTPFQLALGLVSGLGLWLGLSIYLFSFQNVILPWLLPAIGYVGSLISIFIEKARNAERKSQFIRHALDGVISPKTLKVLAKNPESLNFEARERVVTIMFIDVVGFSLMAESQMPRVAFDQLKAIMGDIIRTVHSHGGIVNKNLGDGLLCFFGYSLETDESTFDHAEKAFECGLQIQRENLPKTILAFERAHPVYPLRIGLNTASVFLGNIGTDDRLDFTIVGNGVNFAKRLEAACETHGILMSQTTKELVDPIGLYKAGINRRLIQIKHHADAVEAFAFDPFYDRPDLLSKAMEAYHQSTTLNRESQRLQIRNPELIQVITPYGKAKLTQMNTATVHIILTTKLDNNAQIRLMLNSSDGLLQDKLKAAGLLPIETEVIWSYEDNGLYVHGLRYIDYSQEQMESLFTLVRENAGSTSDDGETKLPRAG